MNSPWLKITALCSVIMGIVLFCMIFGGYSSFYRSQNRIENSRKILANACQQRLDLLPQLSATLAPGTDDPIIKNLKQAGKTAQTILNRVASREPPLDKKLTLKLEESQDALAKEIVTVFSTLDQTGRELPVIQERFYTAQNHLFMAKRKYNDEVNYFKTRTKAFPGVFMAKMFGFNKIDYFMLSENSLLPAASTFAAKKKEKSSSSESST
ncbi:MAG: LemA family protein [Desulfobacteraceae bacterium]